MSGLWLSSIVLARLLPDSPKAAATIVATAPRKHLTHPWAPIPIAQFVVSLPYINIPHVLSFHSVAFALLLHRPNLYVRGCSVAPFPVTQRLCSHHRPFLPHSIAPHPNIMPTYSELPAVPVEHANFISYVASNPTKPLPELLEPFKQYDAKLREIFAQEPDHPALSDQYLNIVPVFAGHQKDVKIRARDLEAESVEEKEKYVMPLSPEDRREDGSQPIVGDITEFQQNFALFSESSLVDLDWSNIVAAGSSVVTCLLPVPEKYKQSKRALRQYYHEIIAPASDVDLFIYGLSEEEAIKKILQIEQSVKDSILTEVTTIRTKNAITIASQYPTRHIQVGQLLQILHCCFWSFLCTTN